MRKVSLAEASRPLAEYASQLDGGIVVVTKGDRPLAALVSLRNVDSEAWSLSSNPEFLELIAHARRRIAKGKSLSLEEVRTQGARRRAPAKRRQSAVPKRRSR